MVIHILHFNSHEQRPEPFERAKVLADPEEIHLSKSSLLTRGVHSIPDALEDRSERCHADAGTDKYCDLILENILSSTTEGTIKIDSRHDSSNPWIHIGTNGTSTNAHDSGASRSILLTARLEVATQSLTQHFREVADATNVDG